MSGLEIYLFGAPRIYVHQQPIEVDTRKAVALLAYLAVVNVPVSRAQIVELLWADYDEGRSRSSLRRTLSVLRKALAHDWLVVEDETIALRQREDVLVDVRVFRNELKRLKKQQPATISAPDIDALETAVALYTDDFLTGFSLRDSSPFEEWALTEAQRLQHDLFDALAILVAGYIAHADYNAVVRVAERWQYLSPFEDKPVYYLLQAHAHLGNRSRAIQIFEAFEDVLRREMEIQPMPETQALYMQLVDGDELPNTSFRISPAPKGIFKVPPVLKPFVGRQDELAGLGRLLANDHCRLITIYATGGMGKTTLGLQVAHQSRTRFGFGIFFVSLDTPTAESTLINQLAAVLDLQFHDRDSNRDQLLSFLRHKSCLLLVDNFEQYTGESQLILDLIYHTSDLKVLLMSQRLLGVQEEWRFPIAGLTLPATHDPDEIRAATAFQLLVESIQRLNWAFEATGQLDAMADLCTFLNGMPLALELAAPHIQEPADSRALMRDLKQRLDSLVSAYDNVPDRHRSLYAMLDYSWAQLEPAQQHLLLCLTVFSGSFDEAAVVAVTGHAPDTLHQLKQLALISALDDERYGLSAPLLIYLHRQSFSGSIAVLGAHSQYYADLTAALDLDGPNQVAAIHQLERDLPNIVTGFVVAGSQLKFDRIDQYIDNLFLFFQIRGRFEEGAIRFGEVADQLRRVQPLPPQAFGVFGRMMARLGTLRRHLGDMAGAVALLELALGVQETNADWPNLTWTLNQLGIASIMRGHAEQAEAYFQQSLSMADSLDDQRQIAMASANLGIVANRRGDFVAAEAYQRRSQAIYQAQGNVRLLSYAMNNLGNIYLSQEKYDRAVFHYMKSAEQKDELGDRWGKACVLINLGRVELERDAPEVALETFQQCLAISQDLGKRDGEATIHIHIGDAYQALGDTAATINHYLQAAQHEVQLGNYRRVGLLLDRLATTLSQRDGVLALHVWATIAHEDRIPQNYRDQATTELRQRHHKTDRVLSPQELLDHLSNLPTPP